MKSRGYYITDIILLLLFTGLAIFVIFNPVLSNTLLRAVLGIVFVAFLPGYAVVSFLFPKNEDIGLSERLLLSFATSVAIAGLTGFVLNYTSFGIHLNIMALVFLILIVVFSILTLIKRSIIDDSFNPEFTPTLRGIKQVFLNEKKFDKYLSIILIILVVFAVSMTTYAVVKPKQSENFTEFYILGSDGKMYNYPTNLTAGEIGNITTVIVNNEQTKTSYLLVYNYNGSTVSEKGITLQSGENISIPYSIVAGNTGNNEVEFLLYKEPDEHNVYLSLHFWVNVT
jgi:uncharacterized membrane protein